MALSLQDQGKVWQKVANFFGNANGNPAAAGAFKALREYLAQQKAGFPQLQFVPFTEAQADTANGTLLVDAACKVYGVFVRKAGTATTENTTKLFDDATDDQTTTDQTISLITGGVAKQQAFQIYPDGFSHAAGIVITQHTTIEGATDGSDGGDGFIIIGAP